MDAAFGTPILVKNSNKDRFRQGLGGVVEAYEEVALRLGVDFETLVSP